MDLKKYNLSKDLAKDKPKWENRIHVANHIWDKALMMSGTCVFHIVHFSFYLYAPPV